MPFKTKRQKIVAQQRRYVFGNGKVSFAGINESTGGKNAVLANYSKASEEGFDLGENKILKSEIVKIGAISALIIAMQFALRFAPIKI